LCPNNNVCVFDVTIAHRAEIGGSVVRDGKEIDLRAATISTVNKYVVDSETVSVGETDKRTENTGAIGVDAEILESHVVTVNREYVNVIRCGVVDIENGIFSALAVPIRICDNCESRADNRKLVSAVRNEDGS